MLSRGMADDGGQMKRTVILGGQAPGVAEASTQLPTELRGLARRRLGWVALVLACVFGGFVVLSLIVQGPGEVRQYSADIAVLALTVGLYALTRSERVSDDIVTFAGLAFLVCTVGLIQVGNINGVWERHGHLPLTNFGCVLLAALPLIVPTTLARTAIASLVAAATAPLGVAILAAKHGDVVGGRDYFDVSVVPVVAAALAIGGSRVVYGLGLEVARAKRLGAYQLTDLLGRGGMGEVWRAEHRLLARPAAIKLIRPGDAEKNAIRSKRFEREAQVTSQLHSPHTVELYDFGVSSDGAFYYVMELLDGMDLESLVREHGPQPPARAVGILAQVCHSLDEAHHAGLVHRDIKPANVYLCRYGRDVDFVKVLDFGLVTLQPDRPMPDTTDLTLDNVIQGTPTYMPPEMITAPDSVGPAADLYALGCVGYWLLTGTLVFGASDTVRQLADHLHTPPPPMSDHGVDVPAELESIVMACLAKQPEARPASAAALADMLRACPLPTTWTTQDARAWWGN